MATIAVYSLKGGVGKTTLAVNLAWCAATRSAPRTVLWDLDAQAASSFLLGAEPGGARADAIFSRDVAPGKRARPTAWPRLDLISADASLRALDRLFHQLDKKKRLGKLVGELSDYDRVVLDCPPGLTETADQVMRAADLIVVPVVPSPLAQRALDEVARHLGSDAALFPVHTMVDRRRRLHADALAALPDWPVVPMASAIEAMAAHRAPVGAFAPRSPATRALDQLWQAIEHRLSA